MTAFETIQLFGEEDMEFKEVEKVMKKTSMNALVIVFKDRKAIDAYELPNSKHVDSRYVKLPEKRIAKLSIDFEVKATISIKSNFLVFDTNNELRGYTYQNSDHDKFVSWEKAGSRPSDLITEILQMQEVYTEHVGGTANV